MNYRWLGSAMFVPVFAACVALPPTQYVPAEAGGLLPDLGPKPVVSEERRYGYNDLEISPKFVRVTFKGNSSTDYTRAVDFALLRAAEVAVERGYPYFVVRTRVNASSMTDCALARSPSADGRSTTEMPEYALSASRKPSVRSCTDDTVGWSIMSTLPLPPSSFAIVSPANLPPW